MVEKTSHLILHYTCMTLGLHHIIHLELGLERPVSAFGPCFDQFIGHLEVCFDNYCHTASLCQCVIKMKSLSQIDVLKKYIKIISVNLSNKV
jgi:hypothetical protein